MTKPNKLKTFKRYEILKALDVNTKIEATGSVGGLLPYDDVTKELDTSMSFPIGSLINPFGNIFGKGLNIYTEAQILAFVSSGKITSSDVMFFFDPNTLSFKVWDGTEIKPYLGGGAGNMDHLFGDGSDGDITLVSNASYDIPKNFTNFTINSGVTLSVTNNLTPLVIRCTGTCTIAGNIDLSGKGYSGGENNAAGSGSKTFGYGAGGGNGGQSAAVGGYSFDYAAGIAHLLPKEYARRLSLANLESCFGNGGGGASGDNKFGGSGGGSILIIAKEIICSGAILANGINGDSSTGSLGYGGGGGGGGQILILHKTKTITGTVSALGGAGGAGGSGGASGSAGGNGSVFDFKLL